MSFRVAGLTRPWLYPAAVDLQPVRDAYSSISDRYIDLIEGDWQDEDDMALVRRHLTGLAGPVLDPPPELDRVLAELRRLLDTGGMLVIGFFDSDDDVADFDHKVITAYRWPADVFAEHLAEARFSEVERVQQQRTERPDRKYAANAARAC